MIEAPLALAFAAGMIASVNPCGFSLLPAYIGIFVAGDKPDAPLDRRIARAVGVSAAVSVGFMIVFVTAGLILDQIASSVRQQLPWVTIAIGGLLVIAGLATVAGWKPRLAVATPNLAGKGTGPRSMVGYGGTYAIASLSCTLGPFLAVTGAALNQSTLGGLATYVSYALGMGVIILAISVAAAMTRSTITTRLRRVSRYAPRLAGALMVVAGGYAIWYGRWELAVYNGNLDTDPIVQFGEDIRLTAVVFIDRVGSVRLGLLVVVAVSLAFMAGQARRSDVDDDGPDSSSGPEDWPLSAADVTNELSQPEHLNR